MLSGLLVFHQRRPAPDWGSLPQSWAVWSTCLRQVAFSHRSLADEGHPELEGAEVYREEKAYQFLLEIVSGLQSPLVAETEVFGQFKKFVDEALATHGKEWILRPVMEKLITDGKSIRQKHLIGLGGQSYGSLARKHLADCGRMGIVGSGRLTREILPWFAKKESGVRVYCRNVGKAAPLKEEFPFVELVSLEAMGPMEEEALIVAAPVTGEWFEGWSETSIEGLKTVLDLRGECDEDPLTVTASVMNLKEFFAQIEENRQQIEAAVQAAHAEIRSILSQHQKSVRNRPFGWDDLCA
ncbi:MAG: hypothetical protein H6624_15060 [Bdellovibrionaceae bacterium]|nr:hypothetical protein [Bdellovibrionales bacterium]MCB9085664.1 hypothetical protein [Pseudobdellovibrionaceae bacterium]